jgi:peptidoglycan/xylan/chitin deacetylase (PgdA/CDA1 family)
MLNTLVDRALGPYPSRPLLALTTILFPGRFTARLYDRATTRHNWRDHHRTVFSLSFDLDLPQDIETVPWLLDVLAPYPFRASFACIGRWIELEPEIHRRIAAEGHEIINHTYSHPHSEVFNDRRFIDMSLAEQREEVERGHEVCSRLLGYDPVGFRLPHLEFTPNVYAILRDLGYRYSSSALVRRVRQTGPFQTEEGVWEFPLSQCPRHPSSVCDTYHAFRSPSWMFKGRGTGEAVFWRSFVGLVEWGVQTGAYINVYFDPLDVRRMSDFKRFLDHLVERQDDVCVMTYSETADSLS